MPLPNKTSLSTLDYVYLGQPFVQVEAKTLNTTNLDTVYQAQPFVAVGAGLNVFVNVSGTWKEATAMYVNSAGTWKTVVDVSVNVGGTWKT